MSEKPGQGIENVDKDLMDEAIRKYSIERQSARVFLKTVDEWLHQGLPYQQAVNSTLRQYHIEKDADEEVYRSLAGTYNSLKRNRVVDVEADKVDEDQHTVSDSIATEETLIPDIDAQAAQILHDEGEEAQRAFLNQFKDKQDN